MVGLASSMISVLLGLVPLYSFELASGGPAVMFWSWLVCGIFTFFLVSSLAEICSAYPTMGALYYWAYRLGGDEWGPFSSWIAGWCNLLGQIAGVSSGCYAGAEIIAEIIRLSDGLVLSDAGVFGFFILLLVLAGTVNSFAETLLTSLCYISFVWQLVGILVIVIWMILAAPQHQSAQFVFFEINNQTGFSSLPFVALIGSLAAASVFTGYDTASHVAEETTDSHLSSPYAMIGAVLNAFVLGFVLILGMNFCIQDFDYIVNYTGSSEAYTIIWQSVVGTKATIFFLLITLIAIECRYVGPGSIMLMQYQYLPISWNAIQSIHPYPLDLSATVPT